MTSFAAPAPLLPDPTHASRAAAAAPGIRAAAAPLPGPSRGDRPAAGHAPGGAEGKEVRLPVTLTGKTAANAIAVVGYLARRPGQRFRAREVARARQIPPALAAKILTRLAAAGLVHGRPGPGGGYTLARDPARLTLGEVAAALDGLAPPEVCPLGRSCRADDPCPVREALQGVCARARAALDETTFAPFVGDPPRPRPRLRAPSRAMP